MEVYTSIECRARWTQFSPFFFFSFVFFFFIFFSPQQSRFSSRVYSYTLANVTVDEDGAVYGVKYLRVYLKKPTAGEMLQMCLYTYSNQLTRQHVCMYIGVRVIKTKSNRVIRLLFDCQYP